jgi:DNA repair exonuclease SbcCD ATPase subunit
MPKTDSYIKELIGANEEVFQNAVIMSANNTIPFMAQKKVDKRKFIEGILQLNVFSEMLLKTRADYNELKNENTKLSSQFIEQQKNLEIYQKQIEKNKEIKNTKIGILANKIKNTEDKIQEISGINQTELENQVEGIKESIKEKEKTLQDIQSNITPKLNEKLKSQQQILNTLSSKIDNLKDTKAQINSKQGTCSLCKRPFENHPKEDNQNLLEEIEKELQKYKEKYDIEKEKMSLLQEKEKNAINLCKTLNNKITEFKKLAEKLIIDSKSLEQLNIRLQELKEELKTLLDEIDPIEELFKNIKIEIEKTEKSLQNVQKEMSILDTVKFVVSEEGVKTFIIKKLLHLLNAKLNHYLQMLEAPCTCNFNETFEETLINDRGKESSYFNFSGGERKRIDLAVLFMFQDILRNQTGSTFSLSMYDELFDSALDAKGVNKILDILRERVENYQECVYIVSHNKETLKADIDHVVLLQKNDGKTELIS